MTLDERIANLKSRLTHGVAPALATPLAPDGVTVNTTAVPALVDFLLARGVAGLFVGGTTGEGILLDPAERRRLHETAVSAAANRLPVVLHVGANRTDTAVALAAHAAASGAAAIAAVTPTYYGMHDDALASYYHAIAEAAPNLPLLLYDIPHMAVNGISPVLFARLGQTLPSLAGIKSSQQNAQVIRAQIDAAPARAVVLVGNEAIALGSLALGAHGLISGLSTAVPEPFVALTAAFGRGDLAAARAAQQQINRLLPLLPAGARIGAIKQILAERGVDVGPAVPPRPMPTDPIWPRMAPILGAAVENE
ncbi:MAG: dihydrodipicolinate synthase family protein [Anaerolineales bacterium]|nr:dihydrodipicolinate synthase family protein [Anaerolineales bacterium]